MASSNIIDAMESIENGVTPGPWTAESHKPHKCDTVHGISAGNSPILEIVVEDEWPEMARHYASFDKAENAQFCAFARNSWPAIVKVVRAAQACAEDACTTPGCHCPGAQNLAALRSALAGMEGR